MSDSTYRMGTVKVTQPSDWNDLIVHLEGAHALQTWQWGQVKAQVGWQSHPLIWRDDKAQSAPARYYSSALFKPAGLG